MMLRAALAFFTRLPVGSAPLPSSFRGIMIWFPVVGLIVGGLAALLTGVAALRLPAPLCGVLGCLAWVLITGGLHLDGVADCGDGLLVEAPPARRLEIMKDSRLVCCMAATLARSLAVAAMRLPTARPGGLGAMMNDGITRRGELIALALGLGVCLLNGTRGLVGLIAGLLIAWLFGRMRRAGRVLPDVATLWKESRLEKMDDSAPETRRHIVFAARKVCSGRALCGGAL